MVQVPTCSCNSQGASGGGSCATIVINEGYCTPSSIPLLARTVVFCDGSVDAGIYDLHGNIYTGNVQRCDVQCCPDGGGGGEEMPLRYTQVGHLEIDVDNVTAQGIGPAPVGADFAHIENPPRGSAMARWLDNGVDPVAGVSSDAHYVNSGVWFDYRGDFDAIKFISDTAQGSRIIVTYYQYV